MSHRLALGTAQFGSTYGIANSSGQVSREEGAEIVRYSRAIGVDTLDTAARYGNSEQALGEIGIAGWKVVSKLPALPDDRVDVADWAHEAIDATLTRLRISRLYGLLVHHLPDLVGPRGSELSRALESLRDAGKTLKIGASVYGPADLEALDSVGAFDLVQAPFNVVDRRLATSGWLAKLAAAGVEVHARSAFLQGLLLMPAHTRPARFARWQPLWDAWSGWLAAQDLTPLEACVGFVMSQQDIDRVIVGVDSLRQWREILAISERRSATPPTTVSSEDPDLVNPSRWSFQ